MRIDLPTLVATHHAVTQLEQLGDEIAELAANLDAATARLLELLPRGADRPRMASDGAAGRDPGGGPAVCGPGAPRRPRRGWQRGDSRAADAGDRCAAPAQQPADALALIAETALHQTLDPGAPGERYQVVVHVDATVLEDPAQPGQTALEGGIRISAETSRRLACDASRVVMRHDQDGQLVEIGARTRIIPPDLRRALHYRDRPCRFPGCGARIGQGHHVQHWSNGGPTRLTNLVLLCRRHHRAVHEEGYQVAREPDGSSGDRMVPRCRTCRNPPPSPVIRSGHSKQRTRCDDRGSTHGRDAPVGWGNGWMSAGRSMFCIRVLRRSAMIPPTG